MRIITKTMFLLLSLCVSGCERLNPLSRNSQGETASPYHAVSGGEKGGALVVTREAAPFAAWEGAEARRAADAACGGRVAASIYDRFSDGAWIFTGGCA